MALAVRIATADINAARDAPTGNIAVRVARGTGDPPIVRSLRDNDFPRVAQAIAYDSKRAASEINQAFVEGLRESQKLLTEKQFVKALEHLDDLTTIYGPLPELSLYKGMVQLARGKPLRAAEALQQISNRPLRDRKGFFDEINARIQNTSRNSVERDNLARLGDFGEWQDLQNRNILPPGKLMLPADGDHLTLHYQSAHALEGEAIPAAKLAGIGPTNTTIYVQDSGGLNNLNWNVSLHESLRQLPSGEVPIVTTLSNEAIRYFRPDVIYSSDGATKLKLVNKGGSVRQIPGNYKQQSNRCQDSQRPECTEEPPPQPAVLVMIKR
jgi:hypothetical protein